MKRLIATLVVTSTCASLIPADADACPRRRNYGHGHYSQPQHYEPAPQYIEPVAPYYVTPGSPYGPSGQPAPITGQPFVNPGQGQPFTAPTFEGQPGQPFVGQPGTPFTGQPGQPFTGAPIEGQPGVPFTGQPGAPVTGQPGLPAGQPGAPITEQPITGQPTTTGPFSGIPGQGVPTGSGFPVTEGTVVPPAGPQGEVSLPGAGAPQGEVTLPGAPQGEVSLPGAGLPEVSLPGQPLPEATLPAAPITDATILPPTFETSTPVVEPAPTAEITRHEVFMSLPLQLTAPGSTDLPGSAVLRFPGFEMPLTVNLWQEGLIEVQMPTMSFAGNMEATLLLYRADRTLYAELPLMLINAAQ